MKETLWVEIPLNSDFTFDNIPFGIASNNARKKSVASNNSPRVFTAIGENGLDLSLLAEAELFDSVQNFNARVAFSSKTLNNFMSYSKPIWSQVRECIQSLLKVNSKLDQNQALKSLALTPLKDLTMYLPVEIGDYTDFYSSKYHAMNVGTMIRGKEHALQPNYLHLPVAYHGRASSVFVSSTDIHRPKGQIKNSDTGISFEPTKFLDFELEIGFFVGGFFQDRTISNISMKQANEYIFGYVLMNDWSARDIQKWEYVPLGPFNSKNFATSISPWVITTMALEPFSVSQSQIQANPTPLPHLQHMNNEKTTYDINLQVQIKGKEMTEFTTIVESNLKYMYWNAKQQLVHHSSSGCPMKCGDLLGSGTISGPQSNSLGCLLELSWNGTKQVTLDDNSTRKFLLDGDTVILSGYCQSQTNDNKRIGFGKCIGTILPSNTTSNSLSTAVYSKKANDGERYTNFKLYSYYKSSCSWRVRIALNAAQIPHKIIPISLAKNENIQIKEQNAMIQVPVLQYHDSQLNDTFQITQSLAIIQFLDQIAASPIFQSRNNDPLLHSAIHEVAELVNSGIQPLQNNAILMKLEHNHETFHKATFANEVITRGLLAVQKLVIKYQGIYAGPFACGTFSPTLADICLIPQLYNARYLYQVDFTNLATLEQVEKSCANHPWFIMAHPSKQIDAE